MTDINVALIGYAFTGRAHSNAYRQVVPFFSPKPPPRMKVICGRSGREVEKARKTLGAIVADHRQSLINELLPWNFAAKV